MWRPIQTRISHLIRAAAAASKTISTVRREGRTQCRCLIHSHAPTLTSTPHVHPLTTTPASTSAAIPNEEEPKVNLTKLIARAGVASRRESLKLIQSGRVLVNGAPLTHPNASYFIPTSARITIDGQPFLQGPTSTLTKLTPSSSSSRTPSTDEAPVAPPLHVPTEMPRPRLWLYYKPPGLLVSHKDERFNRPTIFQQIQRDYFQTNSTTATSTSKSTSAVPTMPRMVSVGRLDYLSEGLILLTNSGAIESFLEHPSSSFKRTYRIKIDGVLTESQLQQLQAGLNMDGFLFKPVEIKQISRSSSSASPRQSNSTWYEISVREGKNRELRTLLNYFNLNILKLIRVGYHEWQLKDSKDSKTNSQTSKQGVSKSYELQPGELLEVEWSERLERQCANWMNQFQKTKKQANINAATSKSPSALKLSPTAASSIHSLASSVSTHSRTYHSASYSCLFRTPDFVNHRSLSSSARSSSSPPLQSYEDVNEEAVEGELDGDHPAPPQRTSYPRSPKPTFFVVPEKKEKKKKDSPQDDIKKKAHLQRGAPPPRPPLPTPKCLIGIDRPWMQDELLLKFDHPSNAGQSFELKIQQWTGMKERYETAPIEDIGSGAIVWDAGLHLLHYLQSINLSSRDGTIIELGSGTGVVGLGVERLVQRSVVLTDDGPVFKLLQSNTTINASRSTVLPFQWLEVTSFLERLQSTNPTPPPIRLILASELFDTIPSSANSQQSMTDELLAALVNAIITLVDTSLARQLADKTPAPSVEIYFTFEQRGVFNLAPDGLVQTHFLNMLKQHGFQVKQIHNEIYQPESQLCLFHIIKTA